jgi:hypothetical protein
MKEHPDIILGEAGFRIDTSRKTGLSSISRIYTVRGSHKFRKWTGVPHIDNLPVLAGDGRALGAFGHLCLQARPAKIGVLARCYAGGA